MACSATQAASQASQSRRRVQDGIAALAGQAFIGGDGLVRRVEAGIALVYTPEEASTRLGRPLGARPLGEAFLAALRSGQLQPWARPAGAVAA